jgi:hypothetical protein
MTINAPANGTRLSKRAQILLKIGMLVLPSLLLLCVLEGVTFIWERQQADGPYAWELVASRRLDLLTFTEPGAGYTLLRPGTRYEYQGIPVVINSRGLRSPEVGLQKPSGGLRILNIGDSIAFGWGVPQEASYGQQLQALLQKRVPQTPVEVINAGAPGWTPVNALAYLQAEGMKYQPDLVIYELTLVNDIYGRSPVETQSGFQPVQWLRDHTYSWPFLSIQTKWLQARAAGKDRIAVIDPPRQPEAYFPLDTANPLWDDLWASVTAIDAAVDAPLLVVMFPIEYQVVDMAYPLLPQKALSQRAEAAGLPLLDLLPAYRAACKAKPGGPCTVQDRYLFADVWMHPSELGSRIAAGALLPVVESLLP